MQEQYEKVIGIDLAKTYSSVAMYENGTGEWYPMNVNPEDGKCVIPMVLFYRSQTKDWLIGDDAVFAASLPENKGEELIFVWEVYHNERMMYIEEQEYSGEELFAEYLSVLYRKAKEILKFPEEEPIVFTAEQMDLSLIRFLKQAMKKMGENQRKLCFLSHSEAFARYVVNQKKELWVNDVTLFELQEKQMLLRNFTGRRQGNTWFYFVEDQELTGLVSYEAVQEERLRDSEDARFCDYLKEDYRSHIVSAVYLTGAGFYENWCKESIREICKKRRAFKGFNLYACGAAAALSDMSRKTTVFCEGTVMVSLGMMRLVNGREEALKLIAAGTGFAQAKYSGEFIVADTDQLKLLVSSPFYKEQEMLEVDFSGISPRMDKTTEIRIDIRFESPKVFTVRITDLGFGEWREASGRQVEKRISLE